MTIDDGHVIGLQQFHGTAPRHSAFNVLLMADGFTQDQQDDFDDACKRFRDSLLKAVPFNQLKNKINIFGLNVASRDSGVSDTRHHFVRRFTYFDALFDAGSEWVLICEERHAMETAAEWLPEPHVAIVMANTAEYGGSGRPGVAVCSMHPNSALIALHEMGHSVRAGRRIRHAPGHLRRGRQSAAGRRAQRTQCHPRP